MNTIHSVFLDYLKHNLKEAEKDKDFCAIELIKNRIKRLKREERENAIYI